MPLRRSRRASCRAWLAAGLTLLCMSMAATAAQWSVERAAASYDRARIVSKEGEALIRRSGNLAGSVGYVEYEIAVPAAGWYELVLNGHALQIEIFVDPQGDDPQRARYYQAGSAGFDGTSDKIGNFWLPKGAHTVRLQRYFWTGFPALASFVLRAAAGDIRSTTRVTAMRARYAHRKGECGALRITSGPRASAAALPVHWVHAGTGATLKTFSIPLPASAKQHDGQWPIPCEAEGHYLLYFNGGPENIANRDIQPIAYQVIDTAATPQAGALERTLVATIDAAAVAPDYEAGGTRVITKPFGSYRESGDRGWLNAQQDRLKLSETSFFGYTLRGLEKQRPYMVEVDYPDDGDRAFAIALRESDPLSYPVAGGVDSGGEYTPSQSMQSQTLLFWPRAADPRIVFMPAHDGKRAAASRIRVYRVDGNLPPLRASQPGRRQYANWYEEGANFLSMYGAPNETPIGIATAIDRWARAVGYMGGDTLWPSVAVYSFALFPSRHTLAFSQPWGHDTLQQALLIAEKNRMKVIPELHPRPDDLQWPFDRDPQPRPHLLVSRNGQTRQDLPPFHNPLHPANEQWYRGLISELASRYRDYPALGGVSLRFMQWKNPALHNFHSLDWGYDDLTVGLFEKETGTRVPVDATGAARYAARHRWLTTRAREAWIAWRCRKIAELVTRIRDDVRRARPDLVVYIPVFAPNEGGSSMPYNEGTDWLREAGIDPALLNRIEGVKLVNALHAYGRRYSPKIHDMLRANLVEPKHQRALLAEGQPGAFLPNAVYFEGTEAVVPPEKLGFPPATKKTWMSAVLNPPGRHYLERNAILLADTDASLLGDGGNAYTLGQPLLREFLREYRALPAVPFRKLSRAGESIALWLNEARDGAIFYVVNRAGRSASTRLRLSGQGKLVRLADDEPVAVEGESWDLELKPFELRAYRATGTLRVRPDQR